MYYAYPRVTGSSTRRKRRLSLHLGHVEPLTVSRRDVACGIVWRRPQDASLLLDHCHKESTVPGVQAVPDMDTSSFCRITYLQKNVGSTKKILHGLKPCLCVGRICRLRDCCSREKSGRGAGHRTVARRLLSGLFSCLGQVSPPLSLPLPLV